MFNNLKVNIIIIIIDICLIIFSIYLLINPFFWSTIIPSRPLDPSEVQAMQLNSFNSVFEPYLGQQSGAEIASLISILSDYYLFHDMPNLILNFKIDNNFLIEEYTAKDLNLLNETTNFKPSLNNYYTLLSMLENYFSKTEKQKYNVSFSYDKSGYIETITIDKDKKNNK